MPLTIIANTPMTATRRDRSSAPSPAGPPVFVTLPERAETLVDAGARPATVTAIRSICAL
ncbi:MAG: hypothetical protein IPL60_12795 [Ardenticatenia bacterium]|nr:hypothetical protein [Ardenticatenia bacterium]